MRREISTTVELREGGAARIRLPRRDDQRAILEMDRLVVEDGRGVVRGPGEGGTDVDWLRKRIDECGVADPVCGLMLVAEPVVRGTLPSILGEAMLRRNRAGLIQHVGVLSVQVHPAAQGRGVGRALMQRVLWWALEFPHGPRGELHRLDLMVRSDNHRAIALYESLGFERECVRRGYIRESDGRFVDDHIMVRWVGD